MTGDAELLSLSEKMSESLRVKKKHATKLTDIDCTKLPH